MTEEPKEVAERRREVALQLAVEATKGWRTTSSEEIKRAAKYEAWIKTGVQPA